MPLIRFNRRVKDVEGSSTLAITARANELKAQGVDVVSFAAGEPDFDTPEHIRSAAIAAINAGFTRYTPSVGTLELREAICRKFEQDNGLKYTPAQVAVSCGAKHSIFNIIQILVDDGDEVLIPAPYWVSYPEMVKIAGGVNVFLPTTAATGFKITPAQLEKAITPRTKILVMNSPSNPTGMLYAKQELEPLAALCVRHNIFIISDEIYEKFIYIPEPFTSIASLGKPVNDLTITVNGLSKSSAMTGWRIGYCAGPKDIMELIKNYQDHSTSNPCSISQKAAVEALKETEETFVKIRAEFQRRRDLMARALDKIAGVKYVLPQGAFYLFCDFSRFGASAQVAKRILDEVSVALIPGESFGAPGFVRLSFAASVERIEEGMRRLTQWAARNS
ncbi:MAG: pyridoxal phosphate-dependent aminotransferase [Candidatus Omnitrophica bacterium]|nr:pyridoxal phosphate-dependent aminotransferase [Candidatus Omnitrophota bacterium]